MSTRGIIARRTGNDGFEGRYHHWDSYPAGLGATLYDLYTGYFQRDLKRMLSVLIDEHPAGWSTINDADFSLQPGFIEYERGSEGPRRPQCYCHGDRHEEAMSLITMQSVTWCEYAYAFDEEKSIMLVYEYQYSKEWRLLAEVDLNAPAPDWEALQDGE